MRRKRWVLSKFLSRTRKVLRKKKTIKSSNASHLFFVDLTHILLNSAKARAFVRDRYRQIMLRRGAREFTFEDGRIVLALNEKNAHRKYNNLKLNNNVGIV